MKKTVSSLQSRISYGDCNLYKGLWLRLWCLSTQLMEVCAPICLQNMPQDCCSQVQHDGRCILQTLQPQSWLSTISWNDKTLQEKRFTLMATLASCQVHIWAWADAVRQQQIRSPFLKQQDASTFCREQAVHFAEKHKSMFDHKLPDNSPQQYTNLAEQGKIATFELRPTCLKKCFNATHFPPADSRFPLSSWRKSRMGLCHEGPNKTGHSVQEMRANKYQN